MNATEFQLDRTTDTVIVPAGRYYLTDPCYVVRDPDWLPWLEAADYKNQRTLLYASTPNGVPVFGFSTAYGDGSWTGSDGFTYAADAGLLGLVPVEYAPEKEGQRGVNVVEFRRARRCRRDANGVLWFGGVRINTGR